MSKLRGLGGDNANEVGILSNPDFDSGNLPAGAEGIDRLRSATVRIPEGTLRRKIDDLADARWLRDQMRDWED